MEPIVEEALSLAAAAGIVIVGGHLTRLLRKIKFLPQQPIQDVLV